MASVKVPGPNGKCALEFRCAARDGKTAQDLLPPSQHPDGYRYQWAGTGTASALPEIPSVLLAVWQALLIRTRRTAPRPGLNRPIHIPQESPREVANVVAALNLISADCSYEEWRNVVWALHSTGWSCAEELARRWSESAPHRFDPNAFDRLVASHNAGHPQAVTLGTLFYYAKREGHNA